MRTDVLFRRLDACSVKVLASTAQSPSRSGRTPPVPLSFWSRKGARSSSMKATQATSTPSAFQQPAEECRPLLSLFAKGTGKSELDWPCYRQAQSCYISEDPHWAPLGYSGRVAGWPLLPLLTVAGRRGTRRASSKRQEMLLVRSGQTRSSAYP